MKKISIIVVGSSNTDMTIKLDRIPRPGETILGGEFVTAAGGKGANQAVSAARAGGKVTLIARVGRDMFGEESIAGFRRAGINLNHIVRDAAAPSGVALIFVAKDGENSIAVAGGANAKLAPADVKKAKQVLAEYHSDDKRHDVWNASDLLGGDPPPRQARAEDDDVPGVGRVEAPHRPGDVVRRLRVEERPPPIRTSVRPRRVARPAAASARRGAFP